jgi:hypothetical protein
MPMPSRDLRGLTRAWLLLCLSLLVHVVDEAATGFLRVYNPTVEALRAELGWWPMPTFTFGPWLGGLLVLCFVLFVLSLWVVRGSRVMRGIAYVFAVIMLLNGLAHTAVTILGRTVASVTVPRPAPGFWSSPLLLFASIYMLVQLRRTRAVGTGIARRVAAAR